MQILEFDTAPTPIDWAGIFVRSFAGIRRFFTDAVRRAELRAEFVDLDRRGSLDAVLDDVGLTRGELVRLIRGAPRGGRLRQAMAQRLGIDLDRLDPRSRYQLERSCALCQNQRRCSHWLTREPVDSAAYRHFCPNAEVFDAVLQAADRPGQSPAG